MDNVANQLPRLMKLADTVRHVTAEDGFNASASATVEWKVLRHSRTAPIYCVRFVVWLNERVKTIMVMGDTSYWRTL